jgi:hypothetical protein
MNNDMTAGSPLLNFFIDFSEIFITVLNGNFDNFRVSDFDTLLLTMSRQGFHQVSCGVAENVSKFTKTTQIEVSLNFF